MFSLSNRHGRNIRIVFPLILPVVFAVFFCGLTPMDGIAASALRSRVYGFRHTDNKLAIQLANELGIKVTFDMHSSSVVVLTGTDSLELAKAYSLMEIADCKEPVSLKVLGPISDSEAEETIKQIHKLLSGLNVGTLLDPPTKAVANSFIVDVYQGSLIVLAAAGEMEKAEAAYKAYQVKQELQRSKAALSEPNVPALAAVKASEPNTAQAVSVPAPQIQPVKQAAKPDEPNAIVRPPLPQLAAAVEKVIELATPDEIKPAAEPNQVKPEEPQSQEDFMSSELLKSLAAEEKTAQQEPPTATAETSKTGTAEATKTPAAALSPDKPALPGKTIPAEKAPTTQSLQPVDANKVEQPVGEATEVDLKKVVEQLTKQSAEEEKKALQEAATAETAAAEKQTGAAEEAKKIEAATTEQPVTPKTPPAETKTEKPAETPAQPKPAVTPMKPKSTAAEQKVKTAGAEPEMPQGEEELELTITLPEKVEIKQLIELVGKQLGLNYIYDEAKVRGEVMLKIHDGKIRVKDCYALLETVLRYKGFVMTRRGNLVTIVPSAEMPISDPKFRAAGEPIEPGDVIINSVYVLKHINYNTAQNLLRQLSLGTTIIPIAETNTLIITDYSYRMEKIEQVLRILDVPGKPKTYMHRSLQYMQAADLIPRLQKLAAQMENLSITVGTSAAPSVPAAGAPMRIDPRTGTPMGTPPPSASQPGSQSQQDQSVFLDADERTNRILMIGNEEQLKTVNDLIDSLDIKQYNLRYVKEYEIKYVDASEVIDVLNELSLVQISTPQSSTGQTGRSTAQPALQRPGMPQQPQPPQMAQRPAVSGGAGVTEGIDQPSVSIRPNTNSLLVNASEEQHEDIQLVIQYIDVEQKDQRTIKEYEIQNVDVQEIVQTLGDLGIISKQSVSNITSSKGSMYGSSSSGGMGTSRMSGGMTNRVTGMPMDQGAPEQTAVASLLTAEGGTVKELITTEPQMSILESTNSLLIHATPRQHASIALVIAHVDRELDRMSTPYVVYPLENQKPGDLAATLTDLIEGTMSKASLSPSPGAGPSPGNKIQTEQTGGSNLPKKEEERIRIIADEASYSIIVFANKKNQQWVATLIKQLDKYRPQVLLDCTLVEITRDDQFNLDLSLVSRSGGFPAGGTMTSLTALKTPFPNTQGTFEGTVTSGVGKAFYADDHIQALLSLIDKKDYGRVLARPSILVKDNEEGVIKTENIVYVAEPTTQSTTTDGVTNRNTNVTFKEYKAGVTLTITPHISSEKLMQLEIVLDRTDFTGSDKTITIDTNTYTYPKDTTTSNVDTWSIVPSGATIILGGIEKVDQTKLNNKVPILGDIPLVGLLFRGINQTDVQSKLYIFVKANIIQPGDELTGRSDIEQISQKKRKSFEDDEAQFQGLEALPGPKPNPMSPKKVLEDDEYIQKLKEQQAQAMLW